MNHIGDWGTQFGMLIQFMREREGGLDADESTGVSDLMALYKYAIFDVRGSAQQLSTDL